MVEMHHHLRDVDSTCLEPSQGAAVMSSDSWPAAVQDKIEHDLCFR